MRHNAREQAARLRRAGRSVQQALARALPDLANQVASTLRIKAPKDLTVMANSVLVARRSAFEYFVHPNTDYAKWVDKGRKPGKGLPRFAEGLPAVEWLRRRLVNLAQAANPKFRKPRKGSKRAAEFDEQLQARYLAWSRHVKFKGIKAHPFVKPTADAHRAAVQSGLVLAVREGLAKARGGQA